MQGGEDGGSRRNAAYMLDFSSLSEPRGYPGAIGHVGVDGLTETFISCHRTPGSTQPASAGGAFQRSERYPELLLWS